MVHNVKFQLLDNNALVESVDPYRFRVDGEGEMRQTSWTMTIGLHDCEKIGVQRMLQLCDVSINSSFTSIGEIDVKSGGDVVLQYDFSGGIFEMVLEDVDDNEESVEPNDGEFRLNHKSLAGNNNVELVFTFGHLEYWKRVCHLTIKQIPSENLSSGFDPSIFRSVYMGNIHSQVIEPLLQDAFATDGPVKSYKLISKENHHDTQNTINDLSGKGA
ncbi:hypothetical protein GQ457_01G012310 [Hibiscus cannabinus]